MTNVMLENIVENLSDNSVKYSATTMNTAAQRKVPKFQFQ